MEKRADEKLKILREQYGFNPSQKQVSQWKERAAFQDEVNWNGLNAFIKQYQVPLNELDLALTRAHEDLFNGVARLKADPLPLVWTTEHPRDKPICRPCLPRPGRFSLLAATRRRGRKRWRSCWAKRAATTCWRLPLMALMPRCTRD